QLDPVDPLHPPVPAPAGYDQAQRVPVARGQRRPADPRGQQQPPDVAHRQPDPVPGDRVHEQALGLPGAAQQGADRHPPPVLPGVPARGAVQSRPHRHAERRKLVQPQLIPPVPVHHGQPPLIRIDGRDRIHEPACGGHRIRIERRGFVGPGKAPVSTGEPARPDRPARREVQPGRPRPPHPRPQEGPPPQIRPPPPQPPGPRHPAPPGPPAGAPRPSAPPPPPPRRPTPPARRRPPPRPQPQSPPAPPAPARPTGSTARGADRPG